MKREEQIKQAAIEAYNSISKLYNEGKLDGTFAKLFQLGADWADEHPQNSWISVKDHMPEDCFPEYAIRTKYGDKYFGDYDGEDWYTKDPDGNRFRIDDVTHWMEIHPAD